MGRTRPPYPPEFRAEAVRLVRSGGRSIAEAARHLGCTEPTLRAWVAQAMVDDGEREGLTSDERARLKQLEREVKLLREEREILRKAAAFFASETMNGSSR
jgi:transposase